MGKIDTPWASAPFKTKLGKTFAFPAGAPDIPNRLVDMFMGCTDPLMKEAIITGLTEWWWLQWPLYGNRYTTLLESDRSTTDVEGYVQETGHGGRDGFMCVAILYRKRSSKIDWNMKNYITNTDICRRDKTLVVIRECYIITLYVL